MHFFVYQDRAGQWRWNLKAANGKVMADSAESYVSEFNAQRAIERVHEGLQARGRLVIEVSPRLPEHLLEGPA